MNRTGTAWVSAVVVACACGGSGDGSFASASDSAASDGAAEVAEVTGPSCPSGTMAAMGQPQNAACDQCVEKNCTNAGLNAEMACAPFSNCYCPCAPTDQVCHGKCRASLSMACTTSFGHLLGCEIGDCAGSCAGPPFDAGSGGD